MKNIHIDICIPFYLYKQCSLRMYVTKIILNHYKKVISFCKKKYNTNITMTFIGSEKEMGLNQEYEYGSLLFRPVVMPDGTMVESSHGTSLGRLKQWITFLRSCGGFKIW